MAKILNKRVLRTGGFTVLGIGFLLLIPVLIKLLWAWVIPDLFPGAVEQGLIVDNIAWPTTFKLMLVTLFIRLFASN